MNRSFIIDVLKLLAAQAIVLHHLSAYGPMTEALRALWPHAIETFFEHSRLAVQVFLVMGGFLAAPALRHWQSTHPHPASVLQLVLRRFVRLIPPYLVALLLISVIAALARPLIAGDWLVEPPRWRAVLSHVLTVQGWFDLPSLSVGVWYVAMDLHLYVLLVLLLAATRRPGVASVAVLLLVAASMLHFNRLSALDDWPLYFFGAYGLGVLASGWQGSRRDRWAFVAAVALALLALWLEPRTRLGVALVTAIVLAALATRRTPDHRVGRWVQALADASYGTFLTHYGWIVIASALWALGSFHGAGWAAVFVIATWAASLWTGQVFHRRVEHPLSSWCDGMLRRFSERAPTRATRATHTAPTTAPWPRTGHTPSTDPRSR